MDGQPIRRVSQGELAQRLNITTKWLRQLEIRGSIPAGQRDPGSRRKYWPSDVVDGIVRGQAPAPSPTQRVPADGAAKRIQSPP